MNIKKLSRQEKERLYIRKMTELQLRWRNPIDSDWDFSDWSDEELENGLKDTIGQLQFEKIWIFGSIIITVIVSVFIGLLFL